MAVHVLVMAYDQDDLDRGVAKIKELLIPVSPEVHTDKHTYTHRHTRAHKHTHIRIHVRTQWCWC
jgi:hypothetical protein